MNLQDMIYRIASRGLAAANDYESGRCGVDTVSQADIAHWLVVQLADHVGLDPSEIDIEKPCAAYGLDSIAGVSIAGDLEVWLDLPLSPTLLWDYPSLDRVSQYVMTALENDGFGVSRGQVAAPMEVSDDIRDSEEAARLLAQLDTWSDAEVEIMLNDLLAA